MKFEFGAKVHLEQEQTHCRFLAVVAACGILMFILNASGSRKMAMVFKENDDGGAYMEVKDRDYSCIREKSLRKSDIVS